MASRLKHHVGNCCVALILAAVLGTACYGGSIAVYVGYADNLRPSPFFPNPFFGSPGIALYAGQNPAVGLDAGAVLITNTGATSVTINDLAVNVPTFSGSPINLWGGFLGGGFVLAPGQGAIFTQTAQYNFDTSDPGAPGLNSSQNCDPSNSYAIANPAACAAIAPTVTPTIDGSPISYIDSGHVLDTGGFDFVNSNPCPVAGDSPGSCNESLQWRLIGTTGINDPGGVPEPATFGLLGAGLAAIWGRKRFLRRCTPRD